MWDRMARRVLGRDDLAERFPATADRLAERDLIDGVVETFTMGQGMAETVRLCTEGDVPCGPVNAIDDIFADPHFAAREVIERIAHPVLGEIAVPTTLPRLSATPGRIDCLGPELGNGAERVAALLADDSEIRAPRRTDPRRTETST
jgi:crotonobetainyl-CoA:carnitine CoA-transferase CaiB-like acyl-CoA transferase